MNQSGFGVLKLLNGVSKTLNLANQVIPLYKEVSPMVKKFSNAASSISKINFLKKNTNTTNFDSKKIQKKELSLNNPVFFH